MQFNNEDKRRIIYNIFWLEKKKFDAVQEYESCKTSCVYVEEGVPNITDMEKTLEEAGQL